MEQDRTIGQADLIRENRTRRLGRKIALDRKIGWDRKIG